MNFSFLVLTMIQAVAPADQCAARYKLPGWVETTEERAERYGNIAKDISAVVRRSEPLYLGGGGREHTAALVVAVAWMESGFDPDVDKGPCYRGQGPTSKLWMRCDGGMSACMMQIRVGSGRTVEGWNQADLFKHRRRCIKAGLEKMRQSFNACRKMAPLGLLNAYASGSCRGGEEASAKRLRQADRLWMTYKGMTDE